MKIKIRKTKTKDLEDVTRLSDLVWRDAYSHIFPDSVFIKRESDIQKRVDFRKKRPLNAFGNINYVAEINGKIVGFMDGTLNCEYDHFKELGYAELCTMYINPCCQQMGIGTMFFNKFKADAKRLGAEKFVVGVLEENKKAQQVYEKWGGSLNEYKQTLNLSDQDYYEVFYTFEI